MLTVEVGIESGFELRMTLQLAGHVVEEEPREHKLPHAQQLELAGAQVRLGYSFCAQPVQARLPQVEHGWDVTALNWCLVKRCDQHIKAICAMN